MSQTRMIPRWRRGSGYAERFEETLFQELLMPVQIGAQSTVFPTRPVFCLIVTAALRCSSEF